MEIHHSKHHATYVAGLNAAGKELEQVQDIECLLCKFDTIPFMLVLLSLKCLNCRTSLFTAMAV